MRKRLFIVAALLAGSASLAAAPALAQRRAPAAAAAVPALGYQHRVLPNGLNVYTIRDARTANVSVQMWYNVGSKDDPAGRSGFAHLFEHILSRVTRNIPHGELSRIVEEGAGGTRNASTGPDMTNYFETVPANQVEAMLWGHAERMGRSVLDQAVFDVERSVVQEEMRQRVLSVPYGRLQRYYLFDNAFTGHPYRRTGIGTMADLNAATLADARAFHANFYRPDNATLIVSGNFDQAHARPHDRPSPGHAGPAVHADPAPPHDRAAAHRAAHADRLRPERAAARRRLRLAAPAAEPSGQRGARGDRQYPLGRPVLAPVPHPRLRAAARAERQHPGFRVRGCRPLRRPGDRRHRQGYRRDRDRARRRDRPAARRAGDAPPSWRKRATRSCRRPCSGARPRRGAPSSSASR